jgi:hypothetical protein
LAAVCYRRSARRRPRPPTLTKLQLPAGKNRAYVAAMRFPEVAVPDSSPSDDLAPHCVFADDIDSSRLSVCLQAFATPGLVWIPIDEWSFAYRYSGTSIPALRIVDGDILIIDEERSPKPNDLVLAIVDRRPTLRRVAGGHGGWTRESDDCSVESMPLHDIPRIQGVAVAVMHSLALASSPPANAQSAPNSA